MADKNELIAKIELIIGNESLSERDVLQRIKELYDAQMQAMYPVNNTLHFSILLSNCLKASAAKPDNVIYSGFKYLDRLIGGFLEDEFVIVGGRPGMGVTQLFINFALNISKTTPLLFFEYGLFEQALGARFLASICEIQADKIARQTLSPKERLQLNKKAAHLYQHKLFINSHPETDIDVLKAHCIQKIKEEHIKVIIVDCIQSLHSRSYHYRNRDSEMTYISNELKQLAREQHVCVIAGSNLNRSVETRMAKMDYLRPQLSDLRDSGAIEQDADKVLFLHRFEYYKIYEDAQGHDLRGKAEIIVAKNTCGPLGEIIIKNVSEHPNFCELNCDNDIPLSFSQSRLDEIAKTEEYPF